MNTGSAEQNAIGFVGTGVMGRSMAGHLIDAGYALHVHNRTPEKAEPLIARGATWHANLAGLAAVAPVIMTIVGFPSDVEQVYLGEDGLVANAPDGGVLVDMTTSSPALAVRISDAARARNLSALDAPVSGGDSGAREARLSIMVGGCRQAYDKVRPLLKLMGQTVVYQGPAGSGQHAKMCNQVAIAAGMLGVCEAMAYAERAGLDPRTVLRSIESGAAGSWSLSNLAPRMLDQDFAPGFYVKHFIKDMRIALESARAMSLDTPGLALAEHCYEALAAQGHGNDGTQALFRLYARQANGMKS